MGIMMTMVAAKLASTGLKIPVADLVRSLERGEVPSYSIVLIHKSIHDGMITFCQEEMNATNYYGGKANISVEELTTILEDEANMEKLYAQAKKTPTKEVLIKLADLSAQSMKRMLKTWEDHSSRGPDYGGFKELYLTTKSKKAKHKLIEGYVNGANEVAAISRCMSYLRKTWLAPAGAGSQGQDFEYYLQLIELMRKQVFNSMGDSPEDTATIYRTILRT